MCSVNSFATSGGRYSKCPACWASPEKAKRMYANLVVVGLVLQALTLVTIFFFLYQLFRAHGRLLLRLDSWELATAKPAAFAEQVPDLTGKQVSLSEFRGKKVLLIYW